MILTHAQIDDARILTYQIANLLGGYALDLHDGYGGFWIRRGTRELALHHGRAPGRVEIAGCYPGDYSRVTWWARRYSITCAAARGARAIAADINRRLLPDYHAELDKVLQAIADHLTALDQQAATAEAVAVAIPGARSWLFGSDRRVRTSYEPGGKVSADFRITDSGSRLTVIDLQVHSLEHARRVAELVAELAAEPSTPERT
ncbi:hypothetical protein ACWDA3_59275 [Nonomuraea rubra]